MTRSWIAQEGRGHGTFSLTLKPPGPIDSKSRVVASITELVPISGQTADKPQIGVAHLMVLSVAPQDDGTVGLRVQVDWEKDLFYQITLFLDP